MAAAQVFRKDLLVLEITDRPGPLLSTAAPPPGGAPQHPFLTGRAHDPFTEGDLAMILGQAQDYPDFLHKLRESGFRVEEL